MSDLTPQSETPTPTTDKITQAARETIYLCNFRVSVDGEWLCLRELNDISLTPDPEPAHEGKEMDGAMDFCWHVVISVRAWCLTKSGDAACFTQFSMTLVELCHHGLPERMETVAKWAEWSEEGQSGAHGKRAIGSFSLKLLPQQTVAYRTHRTSAARYPKDPIAIERLNLMNMAKLSIKGLIESALNLGRTLDSDYAPLQQFFVVMEHSKKTFLGQNKSFWGPLELVEKLTPEAGEITASVKDLPGLSEFYEPNALMMEEEGAVIAGLLVGLNVIDANLCMKGEDLDSQVDLLSVPLNLTAAQIQK
ncbi:hypothetical protein XENOCAPTIV_010006 [Xenoophorus captivus]|uniref:RUN domain-containing protein n=1 Tax=Xenoophorus captivus TaxID=1517983 RepID=A0ABV0S7H4_9TELE